MKKIPWMTVASSVAAFAVCAVVAFLLMRGRQ